MYNNDRKRPLVAAVGLVLASSPVAMAADAEGDAEVDVGGLDGGGLVRVAECAGHARPVVAGEGQRGERGAKLRADEFRV